jgi:hypothetical protein
VVDGNLICSDVIFVGEIVAAIVDRAFCHGDAVFDFIQVLRERAVVLERSGGILHNVSEVRIHLACTRTRIPCRVSRIRPAASVVAGGRRGMRGGYGG